MHKEKIVHEITELLNSLSLKNKVEVLANVLILEGVQEIESLNKLTEINPANITSIIMDDRKKNGETLYNALALQGVTMLMWIEEHR